MIEFKTNTKISRAQLLSLYTDVGWRAYTKEPQLLAAAIEHSLLVVSAWENHQLVGLIRCIGDTATIVYIQDILVLTAYQNQGIGGQLLTQVLDQFSTIRQKVLMTDDAPAVRAFYEKHGFASADSGNAVAFYRYDY